MDSEGGNSINSNGETLDSLRKTLPSNTVLFYEDYRKEGMLKWQFNESLRIVDSIAYPRSLYFFFFIRISLSIPT